MPISCPTCGKDDSIQKVSAIVGGSTVAMRTAGVGLGPEGDVGIGIGAGTLSSSLAQSLSLPRKPDSSVGVGPMVVGATFALAPMFLILWLLSLVNAYLRTTDTVTIVAGIAAIVSMVVGLLLWHARYMPAKRRGVASSQARWDARFKTWSRLYYCKRDDIVFDPGTGATSPPNAMSSLL